MENQITVLKKTELCGQQFTVYGSVQDPLFVASDVATIINHPNTSELVKLVDDDEKLTSTILRAGQNREVWLLTENGLYEVLMQSRKPIAKQFKKGIKVILKEIRKTGGYIATTPEMTDAEIMARAIIVANETIKKKNEKIQELETQQTILLPKARVYDQVIYSPQDEWLSTTTAVANEIGMSGQKLNKMLVASKIIYKAPNGDYLFTSEYLRWNLGKAVSCVIDAEKGRVRTYIKWNTRGRAYIHALNDTGWNKHRAWHLIKDGKEVVAV